MRRMVPYTVLLFVIITQLIAAPAPRPTVSATIDLVKPPQGKTMETYRRECIDVLHSKRLINRMFGKGVEGARFGINHDPKGTVTWVRIDAVAKLPIIKEQEDAAAWLVENLKVEPIGKTSIRVRLSAGSSKEQVVIINAALALFLRMGPPADITCRGVVEGLLANRRDRRKLLMSIVASAEESLAKIKKEVPKNKMEAKVIADQIADKERRLAFFQEAVKEFDAITKKMEADLDKTAPDPVVHAAKDPDARSAPDLFGNPAADYREKTDDSPENRVGEKK